MKKYIGKRTIITAAILGIMIIAALILLPGCGGGGGGGSSDDIGFSVTGSAAKDTATIKLHCDRDGVLFIIDWNNGRGYTGEQDCPRTETAYSIAYSISAETTKKVNVRFYRNNSEKDSGKYQKDVNVTVSPITNNGNDNGGNNLPAISAIAVDDYANLQEGKSVSFSCTIDGEATSSMKFRIFYGDGDTGESSICSFSHPYSGLTTMTKFTVSIRTFKDGSSLEGVAKFQDITVKVSDRAKVDPPNLDSRYNTWLVVSDYEWEIINPDEGDGYTFQGYSSPSCTSIWYRTTQNSDEIKVRDIGDDEDTDFSLSLDFSGTSYPDGKIGIILYCKVGSKPGNERTVWYYIDKTAPAKPDIPSFPRYTDNQTETYGVNIEDDCRLMRSVNGDDYIERKKAADKYSATIHTFTDSITFPSKDTYVIRYKCIDDAKNESEVSPITIDYGVNNDDGGNGGGGGGCTSNCNDTGDTTLPTKAGKYLISTCNNAAMFGTTLWCANASEMVKYSGSSEYGPYPLNTTDVDRVRNLPYSSITANSISCSNVSAKCAISDTSRDEIYPINIGVTPPSYGGCKYTGVSDPRGTFFDNSDRLFVADYTGKVYRFNANCGNSWSFGVSGTGTESMKNPIDIVVDSTTGNIYVLDAGNNALKVYDSSGTWKRSLTGLSSPTKMAIARVGGYVWIYVVTNNKSNVIGVKDSGSSLSKKWTLSKPSTDDGNFDTIDDIGVYNNERIFVVDSAKGYYYNMTFNN